MALTMQQAVHHNEWPLALAQAFRELRVPKRGPRGSRENKDRQRLAPQAAARAREILDRGELLRTASDE